MLNDNNGGFYMPVAPAYGGYGGNQGGFFGGDWAWIILLLLVGGNGWGWGMGGGMMPWMMGGMGGWGMDMLYPWLNNSQHISDGFRDQQLNSQIGDLRTDVNRGFGDVMIGQAGLGRQICETGNAVTGAVKDGFYGAEIAANGRQMGTMQQLSELRYTTASEAAATRVADKDNTQKILDKLCQLELDGVKQNAETRYAALEARYQQALADNQALRFERSQTAQNGLFARELTDQNEILYNRFKNCPVGTVPVAGNTPLFSCNPSFNGGCGCNGNAFGFANG